MRFIVNRYTVWLFLNAMLIGLIAVALEMDYSEREKPFASPTTVTIDAREEQISEDQFFEDDRQTDSPDGGSRVLAPDPNQHVAKEVISDKALKNETKFESEDEVGIAIGEDMVSELDDCDGLEIELQGFSEIPPDLEQSVCNTIVFAESARGIRFHEYPRLTIQNSSEVTTKYSQPGSLQEDIDKDEYCEELVSFGFDNSHDKEDICNTVISFNCNQLFLGSIDLPSRISCWSYRFTGDEVGCFRIRYSVHEITELSIEQRIAPISIRRCNNYTMSDIDECISIVSTKATKTLQTECLASIWFSCDTPNYQGIELRTNAFVDQYDNFCLSLEAQEWNGDSRQCLRLDYVCIITPSYSAPADIMFLEYLDLGISEENRDQNDFVGGYFSLAHNFEDYSEGVPKMVILVEDDLSDGLLYMILYHETIHALESQRYGIIDYLSWDTIDGPPDYDNTLARQMFVEGSAEFFTQKYEASKIGRFDSADRKITNTLSRLHSLGWLYSIETLWAQAMAPYVQGVHFVRELVNDGGIQVLGSIHRNLPVSSEQVMHPELYPDEKPIEVSSRDWEPSMLYLTDQQDVYGEFRLLNLLRNFMDLDLAREAAAGWGGDSISIWSHDSGSLTFTYDYVGDSVGEAEELETALQVVIDSFDEEDGKFMQVTRDGDHLLWVGTSDQDQVEELFDLAP